MPRVVRFAYDRAALESEMQPCPEASASPSDATCAPWVLNQDAPYCMQCHALFRYPVRRRHHCRRCGRVVCDECSQSRRLLPHLHASKPQRVCDRCVEAATGRLARPRPALSSKVPGALGVVRVRLIEARGLMATDRNLVGQKTGSRGERLHTSTRNHKSEILLENATGNPLAISGKNPLVK